jgi:polyphosphate kinase
MLATYFSDNVRARVMKPDGTYVRLTPPSENKAVDIQEWLMKNNLGTKKS